MPGFIGQHLPTAFVSSPPLGSSTLFFDSGGTLVIKRSDGSTVPVGASGGSFTFSFTQSVSVNIVTDMTYQQYMTELVLGVTPSYYRITDFKTRGYILGGGLSDTYTGVTESLIVFASGTQSFPNALSETYPNDEIFYDPYGVNWLDDFSFSTDGINLISDFKGVIYKRKDTIRNISGTWDWRHAEVRRWRVDQTAMGLTAWVGGVTWSQGDFVEDSNGTIYWCLEEHYTPGGTGATSFSPETYYASGDGWSGVDTTLTRQNAKYHWLRLWQKDLPIVPAWATPVLNGLGNSTITATLSSTFSRAFGRKTSVVNGYYFLDVPIDLSSYQDANLFYYSGATPSINENVESVDFYFGRQTAKDIFGSIVLQHRIDTPREINTLSVSGNNLTWYDRVPIVSAGILSNGNERIAYNTFKDINDTFIYGDEYVQSGNPDIVPLWQDNEFQYDSTILGYSQGNKVTSNLSSLYEECIIVEGILYGNAVRECTVTKVNTLSILSYLQNCSNFSIGGSQQDKFVRISASEYMDGEENTFLPNLTDASADVRTNNEFGPGFERNIIGEGGINDTLIASRFEGNYFYGIDDCNIESNFTGNRGASNSVTPSDDIIRSTNISANITNLDFTNATHIYGYYSTNIIKSSGGLSSVDYITYFDQFGVQQVVGATA